MGRGSDWGMPPSSLIVNNGGSGSTQLFIEREEHWRHFNDSVNEVSFGFVATAILISMFFIMAIFERFLIRPRSSPLSSSSVTQTHHNLEAQMGFSGKIDYPSHKIPIYSRGVSVLMPGDEIPTYIAYPAPPSPCPPEPMVFPLHQHHPRSSSSSN